MNTRAVQMSDPPPVTPKNGIREGVRDKIADWLETTMGLKDAADKLRRDEPWKPGDPCPGYTQGEAGMSGSATFSPAAVDDERLQMEAAEASPSPLRSRAEDIVRRWRGPGYDYDYPLRYFDIWLVDAIVKLAREARGE